MTLGHRSTSARVPVIAGLALLAGLLIALVDSSAGWDSTGVTAGALLLAGGAAAYLGRGRPWLWAMLVGLPTPIIEIAGSGATGSLLALAFAATGAAIGWALAGTP